MNIFSLLGIIGTFVAMIVSMLWGGVSVMSFLDLPSFFIVVVASISILMFAGPKANDSIGIFNTISMTFKTPDFQEKQTILKFIAFAEKARREGLLSLEDEINDIDDNFIRSGLRLVVDGTDQAIVRDLLEIEVNKMQERHAKKLRALDLWATVAPACGMWGTVIGLVGMMKNLDDPSSVGPSMAVALITTLYGSIVANAIAIPAARKLRAYDADEVNSREMVIEAILSIQAGDNPRIIGQKLLSYLNPIDRKDVESQLNSKD